MKHDLLSKSHSNVSCPITKVSQILGDTWTILIIKELLSGEKRFNELQRALSESFLPNQVSTKTLSERLKFLRETELITKIIENDSSVKIIYKLSPKGQALETIFDDIKKYGDEYLS